MNQDCSHEDYRFYGGLSDPVTSFHYLSIHLCWGEVLKTNKNKTKVKNECFVKTGLNRLKLGKNYL